MSKGLNTFLNYSYEIIFLFTFLIINPTNYGDEKIFSINKIFKLNAYINKCQLTVFNSMPGLKFSSV